MVAVVVVWLDWSICVSVCVVIIYIFQWEIFRIPKSKFASTPIREGVQNRTEKKIENKFFAGSLNDVEVILIRQRQHGKKKSTINEVVFLKKKSHVLYTLKFENSFSSYVIKLNKSIFRYYQNKNLKLGQF